MRLGNLDLHLLDDGDFRLDGGAMFGVVPRTMWEKAKPADDRNRIRMATNCLLISRGSDLLLIDTGIGDKNDERFRDIFGMDPRAVRLPDAIRRAGFEPEQVTHVLLTHLHFDHCGWNTRRPASGSERIEDLVPTFPNATYWLEKGEVEHARHPNERDRASYDPRNWEPLFAAGVVRLYDGGDGGAGGAGGDCRAGQTADGAAAGTDNEPIPGVRAVRVPGHNESMCIVLIDGFAAAAEAEAAGGAESAETRASRAAAPFGGRAIFFADLVPTAAHVAYPWIMGYDLYPMTTLANKKLWLPRAAAEGSLAIFQHEAEEPFGTVVEDKPGRPRAVPVPRPH